MASSGSSATGSGSYGGSVAGKGGYSNGTGKGSYSLAGAGSYGKGDSIGGYLTNYSKGIGTGYINNRLDSYLNKSNSYKNSQFGKGYELKDFKSMIQSLFQKNKMYDVEILKRPTIDLEERLKKYKRKCPSCGSGAAGRYSMN